MLLSQSTAERKISFSPDFMLIKVKVFPNSKKDELIIKSADAFDVKVKEKPEQGRANKAVARILSRYFKIGESGVIMVKGGKRRSKIFEIKKRWKIIMK